MRKTASFILTFLFLSGAAFSQTVPASSFTMELKNFSDKIYSQKKTTFLIETPDIDFRFPSTSTQKTLKTVNRNGKRFISLQTGTTRLNDKPGPSMLSDSYLLTLKDEDIINASKKLAGSDPVKNVSQFVYNHIKDKKLGIPVIPAAAIFKNRSGDCTEHAVLTVSLLRAMRIPSRAVVGVILAHEFLGKRNVLVYHMWAEAYIKGQWVLLDSTRPGVHNENLYIAFAYHSLKTESPLQYLSQMSRIYGMKISCSSWK